MRTAIYIDGFNFYYLTVKDTPYKWLDFKSLFTKLLDDENEIVSIKYFTALVDGKKDPRKPIRQQTYLRALKEYIPELKIYKGFFRDRVKVKPLAVPNNNDSRKVSVIIREEKETDVNFAVHLVNDAWREEYDRAIVVSNDSDILGAVRIVKHQRKKSIGSVIYPRGHPNRSLIKLADFSLHIREEILKNSQLPNKIPGTNLIKPSEW